LLLVAVAIVPWMLYAETEAPYEPEVDAVEEPTPAEAAEAGPTPDALASELAKLRLEIAELKHKIVEREAESNGPDLNRIASPAVAANAGSPVDPQATGGLLEDPNLRLVLVAIVSLVAGVALGASRGRRRGRSQRSRLRF
jgi:hypothetical protein